MDLNHGPTGYEGGGLPHYSIPSNRYEHDGKGFPFIMLLDFIELGWCNMKVVVPPLHRGSSRWEWCMP